MEKSVNAELLRKRKKQRLLFLLAAVSWLLVFFLISVSLRTRRQAADYEVRKKAAEHLQVMMDRVKEYKTEAGLGITEEDKFATGMVGDDYTEITTTLGAPEAKRTTANPDMAALLVKMLKQAGVTSGDTVGAGFSGSFPTMNLAVIAACEAMDVKLIYIASMGASTYGANQRECTFPDMVCRLYLDGIIKTPPALITPGGDYDCGAEMFEEEREECLSRIEGYHVAALMREKDFEKNLSVRRNLYETQGPISVFIGVGGNVTTIGKDEDTLKCGVVMPYTVRAVKQTDGLLQRYNAEGMPVLHILNIKRLMADYGMAFDPEELPPIGESAAYYDSVMPKWPALIGILGALLLLAAGFRKKRE